MSLFRLVYSIHSIYRVLSLKLSDTPVKGLKCISFIQSVFSLSCDFYRATACNATHGIAVGILSVRPSVRPSVRCVYCDKTKQRTVNILIPHETAITLVF